MNCHWMKLLINIGYTCSVSYINKKLRKRSTLFIVINISISLAVVILFVWCYYVITLLQRWLGSTLHRFQHAPAGVSRSHSNKSSFTALRRRSWGQRPCLMLCCNRKRGFVAFFRVSWYFCMKLKATTEFSQCHIWLNLFNLREKLRSVVV